MKYPKIANLNNLSDEVKFYAQLKAEYGSKGVGKVVKDAEKALKRAVKELKRLPVDERLAAREPDELENIKALRPDGPRRLIDSFKRKDYLDKLEGAFLGRLAACTLGAPVEFWSVEKMAEHAEYWKEPFPPVDYWKEVPDPYSRRYGGSKRIEYTRDVMNGVPVDDDIMYTMIGLLITEEYGVDFTTDDVGKAWVKYLPVACTAEEVALNNLKKGISADKAGGVDNPYCELIGAFIRSDPWGYIAAGWPQKAAELAYRDAFLSHRKQGIYGEMFFAATIAAAFVVDDPIEAVKIGLTEIPAECTLAKEIRWALDALPSIRNYLDGRAAIEQRYTQVDRDVVYNPMYMESYKGMHHAHTINNAAIVVFGLAIGGGDFTKTAAETVAMGMDNDCTAATAGSIVGAIAGKDGVEPHWSKPFNNTIHSYLIGKKKFTISGALKRFAKCAAQCGVVK